MVLRIGIVLISWPSHLMSCYVCVMEWSVVGDILVVVFVFSCVWRFNVEWSVFVCSSDVFGCCVAR